jgi:FkbM family methyltransferase
MQSVLKEILKPARLTEIVDIGANPVDGDPPYKGMMESGLARVTGFEPQAQALEELLKRKSEAETYLPYAVGDGNEHTLRICAASGMTSLLEPDPSTLGLFEILRPLGEVIERVPISTRRLDEINEIETIDFLKMDIQGGELNVLRNGRQKLSEAIAIQIEISFVTLYQNQPGFGEIDLELRAQGFMPHCFAALKKWPIAPFFYQNDNRRAVNQLLEADLVYVKDFSKPDGFSDEQLKQLALVAHEVYGSFDLTLRCLSILEGRGAIAAGSQGQYIEALNSPQA